MKLFLKVMLIGAFAGLLFFPFLGRVHLFDWDEINFAESAREMIMTGDYLTVRIDYLPFWEKPPLFIWMQVLSMKVFGINEYAARFPDALCGVISLMFLFYAGRRWKDERTGLIWVIVYVTSVLPFLYFKSGIIDPWFNLFIFISLFCVIEHKRRKRGNGLMFLAGAGLSLGLAVLTKGPVALLIFSLTVIVFWMMNRFRFWFGFRDFLWFLVPFVLAGGSWFFLMMANGHTDLMIDFLVYQVRLFSTSDAGHSGTLLYHPLVLLAGLFPASLFFVDAHFRRAPDPADRELNRWMKILFWVVLILFSVVQTKIVHYSSMCYFPMTYLAATRIRELTGAKRPVPAFAMIVITGVFLLLATIILLIPQTGLWRPLLESRINDPFALESLKANVQWSTFDGIPGLILIIGLITLLILRRRAITQWMVLAVTMMTFIISMVIIFPRKVEGYSQNALIGMCKSMKGKQVYFKPHGFHSYAHLFYSEKQPGGKDYNYIWNFLELQWNDHPIYLVTKKGEEEEILQRYPGFRLVTSRNGYLLLFQDRLKSPHKTIENFQKPL